jgi:hypothetical protein
MRSHPRATLGPAGRFALTEAIADGMSQKGPAPEAGGLGDRATPRSCQWCS